MIVVLQCETVNRWVNAEGLTHRNALAAVRNADLLRVQLDVVDGQVFLDLVEIVLILVVHAIAGSLLAFLLLLLLLLPRGL